MNLADLFTSTSLTGTIQKLPWVPTKIGASGLFSPKPVRSTSITIDEREGKLSLVANASRRDNGPAVSTKKTKTRTFTTTHLPQRGTVLAEDYQGLRDFGSEDSVKAISSVVNDRMQSLKDNIAVTREWQRIGAIRGKILDADATVIVDLYSDFEVPQKTINMSLVGNTAPNNKIREALRAMDAATGALLVTKRRAYCSATFFDALVENAVVKEPYANYQGAQDRLGGDTRSGFVHCGVEYIEYTATISGQAFIPDGEAYLFPVAQGIFIEAFAPANYSETINTMGLDIYAKSKALDFDKGYDIEAQSNPLALNLLPAATIRLLAA